MANRTRVELCGLISVALTASACGPQGGGQSGTDADGHRSCRWDTPVLDLDQPVPGYGISAQALYTRVEGQWLLWQTPQSSACEAVPLTFSVRRGDAGEASSDCNMIRLDAQITVEVPRYELIAYGSSALFFTPPFDLQRDDSFPRSAALDAAGTATFDAGASSSGVSVEISFSFAEAGSGNGEPQLGGFLEVLPTRQSYSFVPYNLCDTPND